MSLSKMDSEELIFYARLAEKCERYQDMVEFVASFVESKQQIDEEEVKLFVCAFKNSVGMKRHSWRQIKMIDAAESIEYGFPKITKEYKVILENEIKGICLEVLSLLDKRLLPFASHSRSQVEFLKMRGDFNRYLAEISLDFDKKEYTETAAVAYKEASELAVMHLSPTDPLRLGLALNFSVFFYDIMDVPEKACQIAQAAFDEAAAHLDTLTEENYKDVTVTLQLFKDNLALWSNENSSNINTSMN